MTTTMAKPSKLIHHAGELERRRLLRPAVPVTLPLRSTVARIAELLHLFELVADVEDAAAFACQLAQRFEQLRHRLRRQHGGRLIEDQQLRACSRQRTISTRWRSPTERCARRAGSIGMP